MDENDADIAALLAALLDDLREQSEEWKTHAVARFEVARRFDEPQRACEERVGEAFKGCGERLEQLVRDAERRAFNLTR